MPSRHARTIEGADGSVAYLHRDLEEKSRVERTVIRSAIERQNESDKETAVNLAKMESERELRMKSKMWEEERNV